MARKKDITKRPRRTISARERQDLFREFKLGLFALAALVVLVITLCWDRGQTQGPDRAEIEDSAAQLRIVWRQEPRRGDEVPAPPNLREDREEDRVDEQPEAPPRPPAPERPRQRSTPPPRPRYRNYVVQRGDSLWKIAQNELGDGNLWKTIQAANPGVTPRNLQRGQKLIIPVTASQLADADIAASTPLLRGLESSGGAGQ